MRIQFNLAVIILALCVNSCSVGYVAAAGHNSPLTASQIAARVLPSVVSITVRGKDGQELKSGSGFVVDQNVVATNQHVVMGAHEVTVNFADGRSVSSAGFIAEQAQYDIAVIACDTGHVKPLPLGGTSGVVVGESVVSVGSPEGLYGSVTSGIVSGVRILSEHDGAKVIQSTAPISPGSSGGPLVDAYGRVIGLNSFFLLEGQNLNFAFSAGYVKTLLSVVEPSIKLASGKVLHLILLPTRWDKVPLLTDSCPVRVSDIEHFLNLGADINGQGKYGTTPLMEASSLQCADHVEYLIQHGADVNAKDNSGFTALFEACVAPTGTDCINKLITAGADVNAKGGAFGSPLGFAIIGGDGVDVISALVRAGADVNATYHGHTILYYAMHPSPDSYGHARPANQDVVDVLKAAGARE